VEEAFTGGHTGAAAPMALVGEAHLQAITALPPAALRALGGEGHVLGFTALQALAALPASMSLPAPMPLPVPTFLPVPTALPAPMTLLAPMFPPAPMCLPAGEAHPPVITALPGLAALRALAGRELSALVGEPSFAPQAIIWGLNCVHVGRIESTTRRLSGGVIVAVAVGNFRFVAR